jgi:two-component system LytT family response regulator
MNASFNGLTLVSNTNFATFLTDQIKQNRHFDSFSIVQEERLDQIDTRKYNVFFYELTTMSDPIQIVHLSELAKKLKLVIIAQSSEFAGFAFEVGAVDFLTTDATSIRVEKCFSKLIHLCPIATAAEEEYQQTLKEKAAPPLIVVKDVGKVRLIDVREILWVNGAGNYVELHFNDESTPILHRETMTKIEQILVPQGFIRIHRSTLVRKQAISELTPTESGDYKVKLKNDKWLNLSRRYKACLEDIISPA